MVKLFCAIVGVTGSGFSVQVDESSRIDDVKDAIKAKKPNEFKDVDAYKLQLFLANTTDGKWLSSHTEDVKKLKNGEKTPLIETLISKDLELQEDLIADFLGDTETSNAKQVHVLVVVPTGVLGLQSSSTSFVCGPDDDINIKRNEDNSNFVDELTHYRQRGEVIQRNCEDYCQQILRKIDELYAIPR